MRTSSSIKAWCCPPPAPLAVLVLGYSASSFYMHALGADAATVRAGTQYLYWFLPSLALQFALVAMGSALRGTGIVQPTMIVQVLTVILNAVLAPVLIAGWGTGHPMGVAGAGLASSLAVAVGVILLALYFHRLEKYVAFDPAAWRPQLAAWKRLLRIGLPAGGEFALMFIYIVVIYALTRRFGPQAQAGSASASASCKACFCRRWPWPLPPRPSWGRTLPRENSGACARPFCSPL